MNEIIKGLINKGYTSEDATIIYNSAFKLKNIIGDITIENSIKYLVETIKKFEIKSEEDILSIINKVSEVDKRCPCSIKSLEKAMVKVKDEEN